MNHRNRAAAMQGNLRKAEKRIDELERWAALWKRAAKKWYSYALFWERTKTDELALAIDRARELEAENRDLAEQLVLKIWHDVGQAVPEHAYLVQAALRAEEKLTEVQAENARLRQQLDNVRALIPYWERHRKEAGDNDQSFYSTTLKLCTIDLQYALQASAEDTTDG